MFKVLFVNFVLDSKLPNCHPEVVSHSPISPKANFGDPIHFTLKVKGHPEPRVLFYRKGKIMKHNENVLSEYLGNGEWLLLLRRATERDSGEYKAEIRNRIGIKELVWNLEVKSEISDKVSSI